MPSYSEVEEVINSGSLIYGKRCPDEKEYMDNNAKNWEGSLLRIGYGNKAGVKSLNLSFYMGLFW